MTNTREENAADLAHEERLIYIEAVIVITGNPVDGFFYYGPFADDAEATTWAEANQDGMEWWIAPLASKEVD